MDDSISRLRRKLERVHPLGPVLWPMILAVLMAVFYIRTAVEPTEQQVLFVFLGAWLAVGGLSLFLLRWLMSPRRRGTPTPRTSASAREPSTRDRSL
ncbi:MAG: hypothetical protein KTR31_34900 [Myxococcales bacterium]|nr:hypothetical protein [Myxococcales bacterium]